MTKLGPGAFGTAKMMLQPRAFGVRDICTGLNPADRRNFQE
jgi:hypothetical protein